MPLTHANIENVPNGCEHRIVMNKDKDFISPGDPIIAICVACGLQWEGVARVARPDSTHSHVANQDNVLVRVEANRDGIH